MTEDFVHVPVLAREVAESFGFSEDAPARLIDGTVGGGGHSALLLRKFPRLELLGIDRDDAALARAERTLAFAGSRVALVRGDYSAMAQFAAERGWESVDGVLLDIGVSSPQIDRPERGFSWRNDGPLDMRMDRRSPVTASRLLNTAPEAELERVFRCYGEVPRSRKLAAAVAARREERPFATTSEFAALCDAVLGRAKPGKLPSPTLPFQALRIAVNDELGELERGLAEAVRILKPSGRLAVIAFHSLEDRIVKHFFRREAAECVCPPGLPVCVCGKRASLRIVTAKAVTATGEELAVNRRAACARLRVAEKRKTEI